MALHEDTAGDGSVTYDVLIVGAGIMGSAMATTLARQGRRVLLLERDMREPDRFCGELLQPGGAVALEQLGLGECLSEIGAQYTLGYRMTCSDSQTVLYYPSTATYPIRAPGGKSPAAKDLLQEKTGSETHVGRAFHNGRFVSKLREMASREENVRVIEATVVGLLLSDDNKTVLGVTSRTKEGSGTQLRNHMAHLTIIADGQASNLRSQLTNQKPIIHSKYYSLTLEDTKFEGGLSLGVIGVPLTSAIYQLDSKNTRIMVHVPDNVSGENFRGGDLRGFMMKTVIPSIPINLRPAAEKAITGARLRSMPNAILPACAINASGVVLLGDALNIRHPITGAGMTVAFKDAVILKELLDPVHVPSLKDHATVERQLREFSQRRKPHSMVLNILAQLMYLIMTKDDEHLRILQRGFVAYVETGDPKVELLSGLLSGLLSSPPVLISMFLTITAFSLRIHIQKHYAVSVWFLPLAVGQCLMACAKAAYLTTPYVLPEFMT